MDPIVEVVALILGFIGWVMVGVALPNRYWKTSTVDGNVITTSTIYENLWMSCATDSTGVHNCREFPSLLALNGYIQASRALMIASVAMGTFGLVAALIGLQCSKAGGDNYVLKGRIAGTAGVLFILQGQVTLESVKKLLCRNNKHQDYDVIKRVMDYKICILLHIQINVWLPARLWTCKSVAATASLIIKGDVCSTIGLCTMVAVSWYAFNITQEFFDPFYPGTRYEIGEGLYIGWCSAVLAIAGGACLTCSCRTATEEKYPFPQTRGTAYSGPARTRSVIASTYGRNAYV
nr:claudin-15-like isoform X1 [Nerophis lumbriciformis]